MLQKRKRSQISGIKSCVITTNVTDLVFIFFPIVNTKVLSVQNESALKLK